MNAKLSTMIEQATDAWNRTLTNGRARVMVTLDTSSIARGADETLEKLRAAVTSKGVEADVGITGSWGMSWMEPCVAVRSAAGTRTILYANVTPDRVDEFVQAVLVEGADYAELAVGVVEGTATFDIPRLADHPWMQGQTRRLMARLGTIDPENIDHYLATGGYEGFVKALEFDAEAIINEMVASGLGGRGGGGFPTGRKWDFLRNATADPRYLVCNADEGDPGAWVNRVLMEGDPHLIVEGMLIGALGSKATAGYVYIRHEYPLAIERMQKAVDDAYARGLLGEDILGTGINFDIIIFRGAGSYVCGEETGLINSIDGFRGMPRIKPPFPAQAGLWNKPTNVNNVESYANAPLIFQHGAEWWSGISDAKEKGTKMFTISGQINQPCCVEIPFGPTVKTLLEQYGGGMKPGSTLKGFQPGGPLSGMLAGSDVNLTLTLDPYRERGMFLGSGGVIFFDQHTSVIDLCSYFLGFCEDESCGRCTTCHGGTQRAVEILRRMSLGGGRESDLDSLDDIVKTLVWSNCLHGQFSATSVKTALKVFRSEFETIIREKRDPTRTLPGLIQYVVKSQTDPGLAEAAELCPTGSLVAEGSGYVIDPDDACIRCGICAELAPSAIEIRDRFPVYVVDAAASAAR